LVLTLAIGVTLIFGYAFNPWKNDDHAMRQQVEKYCGGFATYYTQEMWDGTIQVVIHSRKVGPEAIEAINGELPVSAGNVLASDFRQPNQSYGKGLVLNDNQLQFCSASGCKNITSKGSGCVNAPLL
jgi:hypothetical protein